MELELFKKVNLLTVTNRMIHFPHGRVKELDPIKIGTFYWLILFLKYIWYNYYKYISH